MKFPMGRFGPKADPRGAQVTMAWQGRTLLGDVTGAYYDDLRSYYRLQVRHFNGEPWPIDPTLLSVDVLPRNGD